MTRESTETSRDGGQDREPDEAAVLAEGRSVIRHQAAAPLGFILYEQLRPRVPFCDRSLREAIRKGLIPSVLLPGGRRRLFHWPSVEAALLRMQRGLE